MPESGLGAQRDAILQQYLVIGIRQNGAKRPTEVGGH